MNVCEKNPKQQQQQQQQQKKKERKRAHTKFCHIYSLIFFQIHTIFPESIINFLIDIPESAPKVNVFTWLITFY